MSYLKQGTKTVQSLGTISKRVHTVKFKVTDNKFSITPGPIQEHVDCCGP